MTQFPSSRPRLQQIFLPFDTLSSDWSDFTGECTTKDPNGYQRKCCAESAGPKGSPAVCPVAKTLGVVDGITVWAEGVEGPYTLHIYSIEAALK